MNSASFNSCITACNDCAVACDRCAAACLIEPDVAKMARCVQLDMDCAQICRLAVGSMSRGSEFAADLRDVCADISKPAPRNARSTRWAIARNAPRPAAAAPKNAAE